MTLLELAESNANLLLVLVFGGLALMGAGYFTTGPRSHTLRAAGWIVFGLYWPTQIPHYLAIADPTNAAFCAFVLVLGAFMAWHELKSREWKEDPMALRWLAGAVFIAATTYFLIYQVPFITDGLIRFTTWQSAVVTEVVYGVDTTYAKDAYGNWNIYINGSEYAVTVILACTAIQSIMIFVGAIACIRAPAAAKWKALAVSVIPIYVLNLWRNASIVWGYKVAGWNPFGWGPTDSGHPLWQYFPTTAEGSFVWMHSYVAKYGALLVLVLVALAVFRLLPELHGAILDVFDLRKRRKPGFFDPKPPKGPVVAPAPPEPASPDASAAGGK